MAITSGTPDHDYAKTQFNETYKTTQVTQAAAQNLKATTLRRTLAFDAADKKGQNLEDGSMDNLTEHAVGPAFVSFPR